MRSDCEITYESIPIPYGQLPIGNKNDVEPGDIVTWENAGSMPIGRVLGRVRAHDLEVPYICVVAMMSDGMTCERWIPVRSLTSCSQCPDKRLLWLFGPKFIILQ